MEVSMKRQPVVLNYANCMADILGRRQGIEAATLQEAYRLYTDARMRIITKKNSGQLGFMELPFDTRMLKQVKQFARRVKGKFQNLVVIGIGGSALGNIAVQSALQHPFWNLLSDRERKKYPRLFVTDNIDPDGIKGLSEVLDFKKTLFNVISKSGTTAECLANYFFFRSLLIKKVGRKYKKHLVITTDASNGFLRKHAEKEGIVTLPVPKNVGGRFSVLSPVGLLSAAVTGIPVDGLMQGARDMYARCDTDDLTKNPAAIFALINYLMYQAGKHICVMMPYSQGLKDIADWFRQLWAESLGKRVNNENVPVHAGPTPVKALGVTDQHSQVQLYVEGPYDKIVVFITVQKHASKIRLKAVDRHYLNNHTLNELFAAEERATRAALTKSERANMNIILPEVNAYTIGQLIFMLELATAYCGEFFGIDAFNQPGVELGKLYTHALMGRKGFDDKRRELETFLGGDKHTRGKTGWTYVV